MNELLIFIGSSVILVPIFHRLGLGSVLAFLTAGILVGPDGLKLIHDSQSVLHFAELGVVLLLFMIGLEIQPSKLITMRKQLLGLGGTQVFVCTLFYWLIAFLMGVPVLTAALMGFALSLSSTAFALQSLTEKGQFGSEFGRSSFSILLMQDLVAIPALAIIPLLGDGQKSGPEPWHMAIALPVFIGVLFVISRYLIRPLFREIASTRAREMFTALTLFIVLGVATLMQKIGLSAALGTFLAGVLLADSEYRHELEINLEPFKGLLMGLFFIAVGMDVSLTFISSHALLVIFCSLFYMGSKYLIIYGLGRWKKLNHENSKLMALNISQGGEFAFVIFGILLSSKLAESEHLKLLSAIVTVSMIMSPIVNFVSERCTTYNRRRNKIEPNFDEIPDNAPSVILAGYGRFGQIFGRLMKAQNIPYVAIEQDPDQIDLVRKFGTKVYYGDASRLDLLKSAGADKAKYFVLAIDDVDISLHTASIVKENFPHLKIFARARNRGHAFELMDLGITHFKRETFDSSAYFVGELLEEMGYSKDQASNLVNKFIQHDEIMLLEQYKVRKDDKNFVSVTNQAAAQLEEVLRAENTQSYINIGK